MHASPQAVHASFGENAATRNTGHPRVFPGSSATIRSIGLATTTAMMIALSGVASVAFAETDASVSTTETLAALSAVPGVLSASKDITPISSVEAVAVVRQSGTTVTVYRDPSAGVRVSQQGGSYAVHVPRAGHEQPALVAPGVAAYPGTASSSTAVQTLKDGGVRLLTVMTSSAAAET